MKIILPKSNPSILLAVFVVLICFSYPGQSNAQTDAYDLEQLQSKTKQLLEQERFEELLAYLSQQKEETRSQDDLLYVEYYSILAKSSYLDYLEKKEDWANFYEKIHVFDEQIINTVNSFAEGYPQNELAVDMQYLLWEAYIREEDQANTKEAFNNLTKTVIQYTEQSNDISKLQEIAQKVNQRGKITQFNKLFAEYKDYLLRKDADTNSIETLAEIARGYLKEKRVDTAIIIYEHYFELVLKKYTEVQAKSAVKTVVELFRDHGFLQAEDGEFAERIYTLIESNFGPNSLNEEELLARGFNLDAMGDYERATEEYKQFVKTFIQSSYLPEVYTRLGVINMYNLGQPEQAEMFFEKVINEFPDSFYAPFCTYYKGLLLQWKKEYVKAHNLYSSLAEDKGPIAELSRQRLKEIAEDFDMAFEVAYPFDLMYAGQSTMSSSIVMSLECSPQRAFVGTEVIWKATAQDFSAGTIQPPFKYQWFGDLGAVEDPGSTTEFKTSYAAASPKVVCCSAAVGDNENIICKILWVHDLIIKTPKQGQVLSLNSPVEFVAEIVPISIEDSSLLWRWQITGEETVQIQNRSFEYSFSKPGRYELQLEVSLEELKIVRKFVFDVAESE